MRAALGGIVAVVVGAVLSGCSSSAAPPSGAPVPTATREAGPRHGAGAPQPDPFLVRYGSVEVRLWPHTFCVHRGCVDGFDDDPVSVGSPSELLVRIPRDGFDTLTATQFSTADYCTSRTTEAAVTDLGDGWWRVRPVGPADVYRVMLSAWGSAGDSTADLSWRTPEDRPLPAPTASLAVIADHDGHPDSYGVELSVQDLTETPAESAATITVTAANGRSHTFQARHAEECAGEGRLRFTASIAEGRAAASLGDPPFTYRVELTIDGVTRVGVGTYPDDAAPDELSVPLIFDEPLP